MVQIHYQWKRTGNGMIAFDHPRETPMTDARRLELLTLAHDTLQSHGMADMDEYGDMLKWGLPKQDGSCRNIHVFHPDWCSFGDQFRGTIHYHPGEIRGSVLLGEMEHYTYEPLASEDGDRFLQGTAYRLKRHTHVQSAGIEYTLRSHVPHWLKPTSLTLTYFEEDDTEEMGDLLNPASEETDVHTWEQADAEQLLPVLLQLMEAEIESLRAASGTASHSMAQSRPLG